MRQDNVPVASRNEKDFENQWMCIGFSVLSNIYKYPQILKQEGWHYELEDPSEELRYKGVVYNEMKEHYRGVGAFEEASGNLVPG